MFGSRSRQQLSKHQSECEFDFLAVAVLRDNLPKSIRNCLDMTLGITRQPRDHLSDSQDLRCWWPDHPVFSLESSNNDPNPPLDPNPGTPVPYMVSG
jgi:hypothetical protein